MKRLSWLTEALNPCSTKAEVTTAAPGAEVPKQRSILACMSAALKQRSTSQRIGGAPPSAENTEDDCAPRLVSDGASAAIVSGSADASDHIDAVSDDAASAEEDTRQFPPPMPQGAVDDFNERSCGLATVFLTANAASMGCVSAEGTAERGAEESDAERSDAEERDAEKRDAARIVGSFSSFLRSRRGVQQLSLNHLLFTSNRICSPYPITVISRERRRPVRMGNDGTASAQTSPVAMTAPDIGDAVSIIGGGEHAGLSGVVHSFFGGQQARVKLGTDMVRYVHVSRTELKAAADLMAGNVHDTAMDLDDGITLGVSMGGDVSIRIDHQEVQWLKERAPENRILQRAGRSQLVLENAIFIPFGKSYQRRMDNG